jgi:hypothetical protein
MKGQVGAPRLIGDERATTGVADLGDSGEIRACPYGVGLVTSAPRASGCASSLSANAATDGGWARFRSGSQAGSTQIGRIPARIRPEITDLCASRPTSSFSSGPATASIATEDRTVPLPRSAETKLAGDAAVGLALLQG